MDNENLNNDNGEELNEALECIDAPWYKKLWHGIKKGAKYLVAAACGGVATLGIQKLLGKGDDDDESSDENDNQNE